MPYHEIAVQKLTSLGMNHFKIFVLNDSSDKLGKALEECRLEDILAEFQQLNDEIGTIQLPRSKEPVGRDTAASLQDLEAIDEAVRGLENDVFEKTVEGIKACHSFR